MSIGKFHVKMTIEVQQISSSKGKTEAIISSADSTGSGAIDYNHIQGGGEKLTVKLSGRHEAVVFVGCEIHAEVEGYGEIIVDLSGGTQFCFKVPAVDISKCYCSKIGVDITVEKNPKPWD